MNNAQAVYAPKATPSCFKAVFIWSLASLFYFYDYILQVSISAMRAELSQEFMMSAEQFGMLSACYLWAYGIFQIPAGLSVDKFGPRKLLTAACLFVASGSFFFGLANTLFLANLGRVLMGTGAAFALVCCLKIVSAWFPANRFASLTGTTVTIAFLGAVFGLSIATVIIDTLGWRLAMKYCAYFGFGLAALIWLIVRDEPTEGSYAPKETIKELGLFESMKVVLINSQFWYSALYASLLFVPVTAFGGLWGTSYLQISQGFSKEVASSLNSLIYAGFMIGAPLSGYYSDSTGKRKTSMYIANITVLILCIAIITIPTASQMVWACLLFALGFFSSGFVVSFSIVKEINKANVMGTSVGCMNCINSLGGAIIQVAIGVILDRMIGSATGSFTPEQFQTAFISMPICLIFAFFFLVKIKETYCKQVV